MTHNHIKILVFGVGRMGKFFKDFFKSRGYHVAGYDILKEKRDVELDEISRFDVIFVCVPMDEIDKALKEIVRFADKNALLVDVSSLKSYLRHFDETGFDYMSIHPMFGSDVEIALSNVLIVHRSGREEEEVILNEFKKAGANLIYLPKEKHDDVMAKVQGLSHFILISLADYLREDVEELLNFSSPIFYILYKLASRIVSQDWSMYFKIQENAEIEREKFLKHLIRIHEDMKDEGTFKAIFERLKDRYKDDSSIILDSYKVTIDLDEIEELRSCIRVLDSLILRLIEKRVECGRKIAKIKRKMNEPIEVSDVEEMKLRDTISRTDLNPILIHKIFDSLINLTKEEEYRVLGIGKKLAILGPMGSFSEEMALRLVGSRLPLIYCSTTDEIISSVESGKVDYGLVPIENSINGTVLPVLDALLNSNVEVFGECELEIVHCLTAKREIPLKDVKFVYSHPQAIAQCSNFLRNYLPHAEIRYTSSTSDAIRLLDENSVAITSEYAARLYKLCILRKGIQDVKKNVTRFYLIRKRGESREGKITALFFGVEDRVGALKDVLEVFYRKNINMRKLESRPARTSLGDYIFFVEVEKALDERDLKDLREVTTFYKIIGVFDKIESLSLT